MATTIFVVDAFTNKAFSGNPAAVCVLADAANATWMQQVAAEMNLSETAFLHPHEDGYSLRWFTPNTEVDLCGHATLASAHILWEAEHADSKQPIKFYTKSGVLSAAKKGEWIELDFPAEPPGEVKMYPKELVAALGIEPLYVGRNRFDYLVEIESEETLKELKPDFSLLQQLETRGIIVTSKSLSNEFDFVSRSFFPAIGIQEDPVTGSAHCCLAPYWQKKITKDHFLAHQASERGGTLKIHLQEDRVLISGQAITTLKSELLHN
ncbi:MAG TPA: PhzF family phenazine biosynthesis protein [Bacillus sp. (in: firmicutes)]|nr:PhzF family phenazine biosynthesis protein [Bacillus sp. (in: firmicutes)]